MTKKQGMDIVAKLDWEGGFDYLIGGSEFPEIRDKTFRKLVSAYRKAHNDLEEFLAPYQAVYEESLEDE